MSRDYKSPSFMQRDYGLLAGKQTEMDPRPCLNSEILSRGPSDHEEG